MKTSMTALAAAIGLALALPALAQQTPPAGPSKERLATVAEIDQLSDQKCGVPRNAADDYMPAPAYPDQTRSARITTKSKYKVDVVAKDLQHAWALAFLPGGKMLVTLRNDGLRIIDKDGKASATLTGTPVIKNSVPLFGLHDVILDKDYAKNRTIYLAYITTPEGKTASVGYIASAKIAADEKSVTDFKVLKEGNMSPRRLVQGKDGTLFAVAADVITPYKATQDMMSPQGKVLRINTDGTIPKDNPFVGKPNTDESIWAIGFRDTQGLAFRGQELWLAENEPRGGDEFNRVEKGKNYGFPLISYGRDNNGALLNNGKTQMAGMEQPIYYWTPSVALSGLTFYSGDKIPEWKGDAFIGGLSGLQLVRLKLAPDGHVIGEEKLLRDRCSRMRDVRQGPDGLLYVLTDADKGEVLRISPAK